jgi:glycosyltransferase involved in cell wall biosynthesis
MINKKPAVLLLVGSYLPGYKAGGPIRSIAALVNALGDEFSFKIITADRDLGDLKPYEGVKPDCWNKVGKAEVYYLSPRNLSFASLRRLIRDTSFDVMYLNSFFSPAFSIKPVILRYLGLIPRKKTLLAPRGEFSQGALDLKAVKKFLYVSLAGVLNFYSGISWHASTLYEKNDILAMLNRINSADVNIPVFIAPVMSGSNISSTDTSHKEKGSLKAVFLSRISPMKNLEFALQLLKGLKGFVMLDIYGPKENIPYWNRCEKLIDAMPDNIHIEYLGMLPHEKVQDTLSGYDVFLLPTLGENFGHVIIESLTAGCPVLISDQTPWRGLAERGAGWDIPLDRPDLFQDALQMCIDMDNDALREMRNRTRAYGLARTEDKELVQQNREMFLSLFGVEQSTGDIHV